MFFSYGLPNLTKTSTVLGIRLKIIMTHLRPDVELNLNIYHVTKYYYSLKVKNIAPKIQISVFGQPFWVLKP